MTIELDFFADISAGVKEMNRHLRLLTQRQTDVPRDFFFRATASSAGSGDLIFPFPICDVQLGQVMIIRRWTVGGNLVTDTRAGTAYLMQAPGQPSTIDVPSVVDTMGTLGPVAVTKYSSRQIVLRDNDALYCAIHSPTASVQYTTTIQAEVYQEGGYQNVVDL